jgi:flagellar biosynthesis protein FliQ
MSAERIVSLARLTLETALWVGAPVLLVAIVSGLVMSIFQVMTSIQENSISMVPRLLAVGGISLLLMPWFLHKLSYFTLQLLSDFHPYLK